MSATCTARRPGMLLAALCAVGLLLAASCSTTSGSTYGASAGADAAAARAAAAKKKEAQTPSTPAHPAPQAPAASAGTTTYIIISAAEPRGWVSVRGLPPGANLYADSTFVLGNRIELAAGEHVIRASAFGYEDWSQTVRVYPNASIELEAQLFPAAFSLSAAEASPALFDPREPGGLGRTTFAFSASARGEAIFSVLDAAGRELVRRGPVLIDERFERLSWDGCDSGGRPFAPGSYRLRVEGRGVDGGAASCETSVTIAPVRDSGRFSSLHGGFSGALFAPDARLLANGRFQSAAGAYAVFVPDGEALTARAPVFAGIRAGGLFGDAAELVVSGLVVPYVGGETEKNSWAAASASLKWALLRGDTAAALFTTAGYASFIDAASAGYPPGWDGLGRFPGLGAGLVLEQRAGAIRAFASGELRASTYYPEWGDLRWATPGLFAWAYLRGGFEALFAGALGGDLALGCSAAARTEVLAGGLALDRPLAFGLELHWYAPENGLVLSVYGSGEWDYIRSWYFGGGAGLGFVF